VPAAAASRNMGGQHNSTLGTGLLTIYLSLLFKYTKTDKHKHDMPSTKITEKYKFQTTIKLCTSRAQTCELPLFCDRDLQINPMTLKLKGDLDILKMNVHTKNEVASLKHRA